MSDTPARSYGRKTIRPSVQPRALMSQEAELARAWRAQVVTLFPEAFPGVLGNADSAEEESFSSGLLEHPQYTRPAEWRGQGIPDVLMSGHHGEIAKWRQSQSEELTRDRRPDLWEAYRKDRGKG